MIISQAVILWWLWKKVRKNNFKTPKPLIKINNKTVLEYIIKYLTRYGIDNVLLLCHYKYSIFKKKFHNKVFYGAKIQCIEEKKPLGSSGALYNARKKLKQNFLFCNGDTFFDINLSDLINEFFRGRKIAQLALKKKDYTKKYDTFGLGKKHLLIDDLRKKKN